MADKLPAKRKKLFKYPLLTERRADNRGGYRDSASEEHIQGEGSKRILERYDPIMEYGEGRAEIKEN